MRQAWRLAVASGKRFYADHGFMRASALAYASVLSLVPLLAVMFAVLKGLGVQRRLEPLLLARLSLHPQTTEAVIGYIDRTNFSTLGAFGGVTLVLTIYSLLSAIEASFNFVWRVRRGRAPAQRLTHYSGVVLLTPFLLLTAVALTSSYQVENILRWARGSEILSEAVVGVASFLPIAMNIVALAVLYAVMPNRAPYWPSVLLGAVAAGFGWHVVQVAYLRLQIGVARYNAIYGALSQLPVTLAWQYVSWVVVLLGAELAAVYELGVDAAPKAARPTRLAIALELLVRAARAFAGQGSPVRLLGVARDLRAPYDWVADTAARLVERGWLVAAQDQPGELLLASAPMRIGFGELAEMFGARVEMSGEASAETREWLAHLGSAERQAWGRWTLADVFPVMSAPTPERADP